MKVNVIKTYWLVVFWLAVAAGSTEVEAVATVGSMEVEAVATADSMEAVVTAGSMEEEVEVVEETVDICFLAWLFFLWYISISEN